MRASNSYLQELMEGSKVFVVPLFQRPYSWGRTQWRALWQNLLEQYDFQTTEIATGQAPVSHFIGSFVLSPTPGDDSGTKRILVVDGQQRLITVSALLSAIRDLRWERTTEQSVRRWLEEDFSRQYLTNSVLAPTPENRFRVLPTQEDRADFFSVVGETPGAPAGRVGEAYRFFKREAKGVDAFGSPFDLERLTNVLLNRLSLIDIRTEPGDNVHRVFQTLNSSGVLLKQIDLLRNHFFMLLPTNGETLYRDVWRDMELRLGESALDRFMWASLIPFDQRVSRKTVFVTMQRLLERREQPPQSEESVERVLRELNEDSRQYLKLIQPAEESRADVRRRLQRLESWGTDTYHPLGLALLKADQQGRISQDELVRCLAAVESFLVRRMLAGIATNNLNRIFAAITNGLPASNLEGWLLDALRSIGKPWPSDAQVRSAAVDRPFYFSGQPGQRRYVLATLNNQIGRGDDLDHGSFDVLHVMPVRSNEDWDGEQDQNSQAYRSEYEQLVHTLGNLTLVPRGLVSESAPYEAKRQDLEISGVALSKDVYVEKTWGFAQIQERSRRLADEIVRAWPGPSESSDASGNVVLSEDVVLLLPEHGYTTVADLAELWSVDEQAVLDALREWSEDQLARVMLSGTGDPVLSSPIFADRTVQDLPAVREQLLTHFTATDMAKLLEEEDLQNLEQQDA